MATGIIVTPFVVLLAFILPGNRVMPLADLAVAAPFLVSCCMPYVRKNIFRGFICGIIIMIISLYMCSITADWYTQVAVLEGTPFESITTSLGFASSWLSALIGRSQPLHVAGFA